MSKRISYPVIVAVTAMLLLISNIAYGTTTGVPALTVNPECSANEGYFIHVTNVGEMEVEYLILVGEGYAYHTSQPGETKTWTIRQGVTWAIYLDDQLIAEGEQQECITTTTSTTTPPWKCAECGEETTTTTTSNSTTTTQGQTTSTQSEPDTTSGETNTSTPSSVTSTQYVSESTAPLRDTLTTLPNTGLGKSTLILPAVFAILLGGALIWSSQGRE